VALTVNAAAPGAALVPDPCGDFDEAVLVHGTAGDDAILVNPVGSTGGYEITLNGTSLGTFTAGRMIMVAGEGDDWVQVAGSVATPAWVFGDGGNDRLYAGGNASVVIGGDGNDELLGGSGRDLLIGGRGSDRIIGNAGDDILIAGYTNHDDRFASLCKIMDEWTRTDAGFNTRVDHLKGPGSGGGTFGGLNGTVRLNAATVQDDGVIDQIDILTGSAGDDWYLYNLGSGDKATGVSNIEAAEAIGYI
jgi:Ca2+-binding RTX toxin-like protein